MPTRHAPLRVPSSEDGKAKAAALSGAIGYAEQAGQVELTFEFISTYQRFPNICPVLMQLLHVARDCLWKLIAGRCCIRSRDHLRATGLQQRRRWQLSLAILTRVRAESPALERSTATRAVARCRSEGALPPK
jgi:hypothetical protein